MKNIGENKKLYSKMQLIETLEWLEEIGITVKYKEEIIALIS